MPTEFGWGTNIKAWLGGRLRELLARLGVLPMRWRTTRARDESADDPDSWRSLDYVHERALAQLEAQDDLWDVVDSRLRMILGVISIVFAAAAAFQRVATDAARLPVFVGGPVIVAIALFLVAAVIAGLEYWPTEFDRPPRLQHLRDDYLMTDPREAKLAVIDTILLAYANNELVIKRKNRAFKQSFVLTAAATVLLGSALAAQVFCQTSLYEWDWWLGLRARC